MTCIVGLVDKKRVIIGGDSAGSSATRQVIRKDPKVFKNGDFIFGCTTSYRMIQLLMYSFKPPKISTKDIHQYMCTDFIKSVRECFKEGGYLQKHQDGDEIGGTFLVAYKNRLFRIEDDLQVEETMSGINAVGCGEDLALGALYLSKLTNMPPERRALESLKIASNLSVGVRPPFIILST